jgi:hypothetical protein
VVVFGRTLFEHGGTGALGLALLLVCFFLLFGGKAGVDGEDELEEEDSTRRVSAYIRLHGHQDCRAAVNLQYGASAAEGSLGLLAVLDVVLVIGYRAGFGDVPWWAGLRMLRIAHI